MKRKLKTFFALVAVFVLLFSSCAQKPEFPSEESRDEGYTYESGSYTLLVYMCGSNLETKTGAATRNIAEMLSQKLPDKARIIIQTGGSRKWRKFDIPADKTCRYEVKDGELVKLQELPGENFGKPDTLADFIIWGHESFPSERFGLILWNHGGGSLIGLCNDERFSNDRMTLPEMDYALSRFYKTTGGRFDFIGFDACLMATYETAEIVSKYADFMIAGEDNEPTGGWDYAYIAKNLGSENFKSGILNTYAAKCESQNKETYTLSCIDTVRFSNLEKIFSTFIQGIKEIPLTETVAAAKESFCFGTNAEDDFSDLIDLQMFAVALNRLDVSVAVEECTEVVNGKYREDTGGISIFYPLNNIESAEKYCAVFNTPYADFIRENYKGAGRNLIDIKSIEDRNGKMHIEVAEKSVKYISDTFYNLFVFENGEETSPALGLGEDDDVVYDGKTGFTVNFRGKWVKFAGEKIRIDISDNNESFAEFTTPVKVNGQRAEIRFIYDKRDRKIFVEGCLPSGETATRITELNYGDEITLMVDKRIDNKKNLVEGKTVIYSKDTEFEICDLEKGSYQYTAYLYDIFGKKVQAGTAVVEFDGEKTKIKVLTDDFNDAET